MQRAPSHTPHHTTPQVKAYHTGGSLDGVEKRLIPYRGEALDGAAPPHTHCGGGRPRLPIGYDRAMEGKIEKF